MRTIPTPFSRKLRQIRHIIKQLKTNTLSVHADHLHKKLLRLLRTLPQPLAWRRAAGIVAIYCGLMPPLTGQTFDPVQINPFGLNAVGSSGIRDVIDLNGDGAFDIIQGGMMSYYGMISGPVIRVYVNTGTASSPAFGSHVDNPYGIPLTDPSESLGDIKVIDWDNDGDLDILYNEYYDGLAYFIENIGSSATPVFTTAVIEPGFQGAYPFSQLVDIDDDGDLDLAISDYYGPHLFYENIGAPGANAFVMGFDGQTLFEWATDDEFGWAFNIMSFTDIEGDGDWDMYVVASDFGNSPKGRYIVLNTGNPKIPIFPGFLADPYPIVDDPDLDLIGTYKFVDIDGDRDDDLFFGVSSGKAFFVNNSSEFPSASNGQVVMEENSTYYFSSADFNLDTGSGLTLQAIRIMDLEHMGTLELNGLNVERYQVIPASEIPNLTYTPAPNEFGMEFDKFKYRVQASNNLFTPEDYGMTFHVEEASGTKTPKKQSTVILTPNPADGEVQLNLVFANSPEKLQVQIVDLRGAILQVLEPSPGQIISLSVTLDEVPSGMYFVRVVTDQGTKNYPLVKQ